VLVLAMIPVLPGWFSTDPEVLATLRELLVWVAVLQVPGALVFVWDGLYMGASRFGYLAVATSAASVVGLGLLALVGPAGWGVGGVWAAISVFVLARLLTLVGGQRAGRFV
jgi:Na+-driven multidrug efflux pump